MSKLNFKFPISHPGLDYLDQLEIWKGGAGFGVDKIAGVMKYLGNPQDCVRSFHVTGTNGKGTTSAVLASILSAEGYKVGLNISPHLIEPNERIVVDGKPISYELIGDFALLVEKASKSAGIELSFHEGITATAFVAFKELGVEWSVIEVGLGGRYDASNIISKPDASIITTVDLDHQHILGETREKIAYEKAGIIKNGVPVVIGRLDPKSFNVVAEIAQNKGSRLLSLENDFNSTSFHDSGLSGSKDSFDFTYNHNNPFKIEKQIRGRHQVDNFSVAIAAAKVAGISDQACQRGAIDVFWPGRFEVFNWRNRTIIVDCAHNPHGISALVDNLGRWGVKNCHIAFGVLDGKDWRSMIKALIPFGSSWSLLTPNSERSLSIDALADILSSNGINQLSLYGREFEKFIQDHDNQSNQILLLTGSIYLIGELRKLFQRGDRPIWTKY